MSLLGWLAVALVLVPRIPRPGTLGSGIPWSARREAPVRAREVVDIARLVSIGLSAGLPLHASLSHAAEETTGRAAAELDDLLRRARSRGLALALVETAGPLAELCTRLARSQITGAPMGEAVAAFVRSRGAELRAAQLERSRTLPVKLIVPIALLLLPGFLALVVGPAVVGQVQDLVGQVAP